MSKNTYEDFLRYLELRFPTKTINNFLPIKHREYFTFVDINDLKWSKVLVFVV